jgi:hypothetical protein
MPLLERLAQIHHPGITHQLVETLAHLADHDPKRVLLTVQRAVAPGNLYEQEPLQSLVKGCDSHRESPA